MAETDSIRPTRLCPRCDTPTPVLKGQSYCYHHKKEIKRKSTALHQSDPCSKCKKRSRQTGSVWCRACQDGPPKVCACGKEHYGSEDKCIQCGNADKADLAAARLAEMGEYRRQESSFKSSEWYQWADSQIRYLSRDRWVQKRRGGWAHWSYLKANGLGANRYEVQGRGKISDSFSRRNPWKSFSGKAASRMRQELKVKSDKWYQWACGKSQQILNRARRGQLRREKSCN